jgi:predicted SAM-dependent methyltransferase
MFIDKYSKLKKIAVSSQIVIELGCGLQKKIDHSIAIDIRDSPAVDIVADLNQGLGFLENETVDEIYAFHFLEHTSNLELILKEIFRVLKNGGKFIGSVPHFSNPYYYSDYTHKQAFGLYSFSYFSKSSYFNRKVPDFYNDVDFKINSIELIFMSPLSRKNIINKLYSKIFNRSKRSKEFYEYHLSGLFHCHEIKFELQK